MKKILYTISIAALVFLYSCEPKIAEFEPVKGNADFSTSVTIGGSLLTGYSDGDLYRSGQMNSMSAILAKQFAYAGGGSFKQPLMLDELGFGKRLKLGGSVDCMDVNQFGPIPYGGTPDPGNMIPIGAQGPYNNMAVPGAYVGHLLFPGYGTLNPYFGRFASDPATASVLSDAMAVDASFFTVWTGNNDVLWYALAGGDGGNDTITPPAEFALYYSTLLDGLMAGGANGVLIGVVDIFLTPFFNVIPYNALVLEDQAYVDALNFAYAAAGITFQLGPNPWIIEDSKHPAGLRQMADNEYLILTLPQDSIKCAFWGSIVPMPANYVIDANEVAAIRSTTNAYNLIIEQEATNRGLAYLDMSSVVRQYETGVVYDGVNYSTKFVTGGIFSLDGVHANTRGYALMANNVIEAINAKYGSTVPLVNVNDYPGVLFP